VIVPVADAGLPAPAAAGEDAGLLALAVADGDAGVLVLLEQPARAYAPSAAAITVKRRILAS
jgi:hypothetical protein